MELVGRRARIELSTQMNIQTERLQYLRMLRLVINW